MSKRVQLSTASGSGGVERPSAVAASSALQQQLSFCCLLCGWDVPCTTCPFNWFGFDPRRFRSRLDTPHEAGGPSAEVQAALQTLEMAVGGAAFSEAQLKAAFRDQALRWHPDCNPEPGAEDRFKPSSACCARTSCCGPAHSPTHDTERECVIDRLLLPSRRFNRACVRPKTPRDSLSNHKRATDELDWR